MNIVYKFSGIAVAIFVMYMAVVWAFNHMHTPWIAVGAAVFIIAVLFDKTIKFIQKQNDPESKK